MPNLTAIPSLVLFDLDGTLVDSVPDIALGINRALEEHGISSASVDDVRNWVGNGVGPLIERALHAAIGERASTAQVEDVKSAFEAHYAQTNGLESIVYEGVIELLDTLRAQSVHTACVTNKPVTFAHDLLAHCQLSSYFPLVLGGDSLPRCKPDPLPIRHAARTFNVPLSQTLMIGDSISDINAALSAPCPIICVSYGYNQGVDIHKSGADRVIDSLSQLALEFQRD